MAGMKRAHVKHLKIENLDIGNKNECFGIHVLPILYLSFAACSVYYQLLRKFKHRSNLQCVPRNRWSTGVLWLCLIGGFLVHNK